MIHQVTEFCRSWKGGNYRAVEQSYGSLRRYWDTRVFFFARALTRLVSIGALLTLLALLLRLLTLLFRFPLSVPPFAHVSSYSSRASHVFFESGRPVIASIVKFRRKCSGCYLLAPGSQNPGPPPKTGARCAFIHVHIANDGIPATRSHDPVAWSFYIQSWVSINC